MKIPVCCTSLASPEMLAIQGGMGVDVSQMPDRSVVCGTMWVLDRIFHRITFRP